MLSVASVSQLSFLLGEWTVTLPPHSNPLNALEILSMGNGDWGSRVTLNKAPNMALNLSAFLFGQMKMIMPSFRWLDNDFEVLVASPSSTCPFTPLFYFFPVCPLPLTSSSRTMWLALLWQRYSTAEEKKRLPSIRSPGSRGYSGGLNAEQLSLFLFHETLWHCSDAYGYLLSIMFLRA